jgi:hypothetical protein
VSALRTKNSFFRNDYLVVDVVPIIAVTGVCQWLAKLNVGGAAAHINIIKNTMYHDEMAILSTSLGFLIAGVAIIGAVSGLSKMKTASFEAFETLVASFRTSAVVMIVGILFAFFASIFDYSSNNAGWAVTGIAFLVLGMLRMWRAITRLYQALLA